MQRVVDWCLSYDGSESTEYALGESTHDLPWRFLLPEEALAATEPATRAAFEALLDRLAALEEPLSLTRVSVGSLDDYLTPFATVQGAEAWRNHGEWLDAHPGVVGEAVAERFRRAATITTGDEESARAALGPLRVRLERLVGDGILLLPTVPGPAPTRTHGGERINAVRQATLRMTALAAVAGLPAISVPLLRLPSQLGLAPVGVSLISRAGTDIALVRTARRLVHLAHRTHQEPS